MRGDTWVGHEGRGRCVLTRGYTTYVIASTPSSSPHTLRYCELYAALCTARPELLPGLATTLPACNSDPVATAALLAQAATLGRALDPHKGELASLVLSHPPGSDLMVQTMVEAAVERAVPTAQLMAACREWYAACGDVKVWTRGGGGGVWTMMNRVP